MKNKTKRRLKIFAFLLLFGISVFSGGYFYLDNRLEKITVSEREENIPYYSVPEETTILFNICEDKLLVNLKFEEEMLNIIFLNDDSEDYGYEIDYTVNCDYNMVGYFIDIAGGIEVDGLRKTGVEIIEKFEYTNISYFDKKDITYKIIKGISESGFSKENMLFIIENSKTDLKFNETFYWIEYIPKLCKFLSFVN